MVEDPADFEKVEVVEGEDFLRYWDPEEQMLGFGWWQDVVNLSQKEERVEIREATDIPRGLHPWQGL